jgi:hypothetical protein
LLLHTLSNGLALYVAEIGRERVVGVSTKKKKKQKNQKKWFADL